MLIKHTQKICRTPEQFNAFSQKVGHDGVLTTFTSYGQVDAARQREIIQNLNEPNTDLIGKLNAKEALIVQLMRRQ